jgi:hypothetical protein
VFAADTSVSFRGPHGSACTSPRGATMLLVQQKPKSLACNDNFVMTNGTILSRFM